MKNIAFLKRIVSAFSCLTVISSFSTGQVTSFAEDSNGDVEYYSTLDPNSDAYQEWKSQFIANQEVTSKVKLRSTVTTNGIKNDYLDFYYKNGIYSLGTVEGDPALSTDNNKRLLYGYPGSGTSYATIRIDGNDYKFTPATVSYTENAISASDVYNDVSVTLNFSLITNQYTGREDVAEFSYNVKNIGTVAHDVGVRIMFDTMLGDNDSSPFRIPTIGDTSAETDLSGNDVPEFWQSFDSLTNPNVIAQGTLKNNSSTSPDRVRFTNWGSAYSNPWDYNRVSGTSNGDSAVCIYWNPRSISNGDVFNCSTYYGLSSLQQDGTPPLAVALTGATKLDVEHNENETDSYTPNPFTVTAYIQNIGDGNAKNVSAKLNLPSDMSIVEGDEIIDLGDLAVNSNQKQVSWKVWVEPNSVSSIKSYSVTVTAANADTKTIQRNIEIPALQTNGPLKLYFHRSKLNNVYNNLDIDFKLENSSNIAVDLNNYKARYYFIDETPDSNKIIDKYYCGNQYNNSVNVSASYHSIPAPYKSNANAYLEFDFSKSNITLNTDEHLRVRYAMHSSNWSSINILNDFSALDSNYNDETGLIIWTKMPVYEISSGKKVWGTEPKESSEVTVPTMNISCLANTLNNDSIVDMVITLKNTSTTPIYLSNSELTYYYMNDNEYAQNVDIYYAGGRINGDLVSITDKISGEAILLETKKDRANSKIRLFFSSLSGALCYNESIDIHLQLSNQNWAQGKFDLENDYSYAGITDTNYIANNIIFTANYLNSNGKYAEYQYGEPIGDYKPTFAAFKIGAGTNEENKLQDYNNFIDFFSEDFHGIPYNSYATGENISNSFVFTNNNLNALLSSDIAYISGHGSRGGAIPVYKNGIYQNCSSYEGEMLFNQIISIDKNIKTDFQDMGMFQTQKFFDGTENRLYNSESGLLPENVFSINIKDHVNDGINENLQWIITAACSQINDEYVCNVHYYNTTKPLKTSSTEKWIEVLKNNQKLKGILGYNGQAPTAKSGNPDYDVIDNFLLYSIPELADYEKENIHDAWLKANLYTHHILINDTLPCGLLVKDQYDKEYLYDSLISNQKTEFSRIYRYTAQYINPLTIKYEEEVVYDKAVEAITQFYNLNSDEVGKMIDTSFMEIEKEIYSDDGNFISSEVDEYIIEISSIENQSKSYAKYKAPNKIESNKIIHFNPSTNTIEEF